MDVKNAGHMKYSFDEKRVKKIIRILIGSKFYSSNKEAMSR